MRNERFDDAVQKLLEIDQRYPIGAYHLLPVALDYTVRHLQFERCDLEHPSQRERHVTGRELAEGVRDYMLLQYGPFAKSILDSFNIHKTSDIGEIVYNLIRVGVFGKTEKDRLEDFTDIYDFEEAFVQPFLPMHD